MTYIAPKNSRSHRSRIFNSRMMIVALAAFALLMLAASSAFMAGISGAIFTTDANCTGTDINIYTSKNAVYIDGGPQHGSSAGLPDGYYYVQVTEPDGTLLGTSVGSGLSALGGTDGQVVHVTNGEFDNCYLLVDIVKTAGPNCTNGDAGYCDTSNAGGEYKVWVSRVSSFDNDETKTDNFKVQCIGENCGGTVSGTLNVVKFYDANTNGIHDGGEPAIDGWKFIIDPDVGPAFTPISIQVLVGDYTVTECSPQETNWFHTSSSILTHNVPADGYTFEFGNVCLAGGTGLTLGFWSNRNGQALFGTDDLGLMQSLNLRNADGTNFDPANYNQFRSWLLSATATNMAYMLSAQLAAMELNVLNSKVSGDSLVYAPCLIGVPGGANPAGFISVSALMTLANTSLGTDGYTVAAGATRDYQECLKNALDDANNNKNFVSPTPCPFSNFSCPNN